MSLGVNVCGYRALIILLLFEFIKLS